MPKSSNLNSIIAFQSVTKQYDDTDIALRNISFSVAPHEFLCIIGPSGCGKSTIIKTIAGLTSPTSGTFTATGNVSMVFQQGSLFPWLTVFENVALGLRAKKLPPEKIRKRATKFITMMGLKDFATKYPHTLSGGQRQRVGIARALAVEPDILLLDEPFSALDPKTAFELHNDLLSIWNQSNLTILMVSHLIEEAVTLADKVILMTKERTIRHIFPITLPRPRHEQGKEFNEHVMVIRHAFFK